MKTSILEDLILGTAEAAGFGLELGFKKPKKKGKKKRSKPLCHPTEYRETTQEELDEITLSEIKL